ncbi:MAG TPA: redoxin domain-containing protein [Nitrososphaeraceae archaeon]|nr:redoxin domain-containing protein [Nitrososphaeraceae archaeon]HXV87768.1 redoxin domain-containing protein [Nitrososphaeraceae archaeon]
MTVKAGLPAPDLKVSEWVQGGPINLKDYRGKVVVVEVFQVNCPGCFIYGIPEAIDTFQKYKNNDVVVLGLATAFEDFEKNTLENLKLLLKENKVIGETLTTLTYQSKLLNEGKLSYSIPFPVGMDMLVKEKLPIEEKRIMEFVNANVPDFDLYHQKDKEQIISRVKSYLETKPYSPLTFEEYSLRGTPSSMFIDKKGILRETTFGSTGLMATTVEKLLSE